MIELVTLLLAFFVGFALCGLVLLVAVGLAVGRGASVLATARRNAELDDAQDAWEAFQKAAAPHRPDAEIRPEQEPELELAHARRALEARLAASGAPGAGSCAFCRRVRAKLLRPLQGLLVARDRPSEASASDVKSRADSSFPLH